MYMELAEVNSWIGISSICPRETGSVSSVSPVTETFMV